MPVIRIIAVQIRLPRDLVRKLDHMTVDLDLRRNHLVEQLLREALAARAAEREE